MGYYLAIKRDKILIHATTRINLSIRRQAQRPPAAWLHLHKKSKIRKSGDGK